MKTSLLSTAAVAAIVCMMGAAPTANGATISSFGTFSNHLPNSAQSVNTDNPGGFPQTGDNAAFINWGDVPGKNKASKQSGYVFEGFDDWDVGTIVEGTRWRIGDFTHRNNPLLSGPIDSVQLAANVEVDFGGGNVVDTVLNWLISHNETDNYPVNGTCADGGSAPCPDVVTFPNSYAEETIVVPDDGTYFVRIWGFSDTGLDGSEETSFLTLEGQNNTTGVWAEFTKTPPPPVPLPAAVWLFGTALIGLGILKRRKGSAAA